MGGTKSYVFYYGLIRTLVALATYSSRRLIMGKSGNVQVFSVSMEIFEKKNTEMFIELSSTFHITFVQIGVFDWLSGRQKGSIFEEKKRLKIFFSETIWRSS